MKLGWDRGKGRWFMSGILPIGPAKKTGSISDSEIDPICYKGILWHDNRANSRMPPSDGACRFGLPQLAKIFSELDHELANGRGGSAPLRQRRQRFFTSPAQPARGSPAHQSAMGAPRISAAASGARQPPGAGGGAARATTSSSSPCSACRSSACRGKCEAPPARATTSSSSPCPACRSSACRGKCEAPPAQRRE